MRKFHLLLLILVFVTFGATVAMAENLHVGASIGNTFYSDDYKDALDQVKKIDENSTAWKIFGGFSGSKFFGLEGGYRDFGTVEVDFTDFKFKSKTKGWDVEAVGRIQIAIIDIFGKAGVMFWNTDGSVDESGTDFLWGLGAGVHLGPIGVRLEWESLEAKHADNLSMVSLGATLGF